ncbi:MAG TPA: hypothetical protein VGI96_36745 [Streptosporangiaceae bacterium]
MAKDAAGYCRISEDPEGREIGIDRQRQDNQTIANPGFSRGLTAERRA